MSPPRLLLMAVFVVLGAAALGGCGGSSGGATVSGVQSCLQNAGYGVTVVPASEIKGNGPENRGPGQTGELLVGLNGARPPVGADGADAVVAFFDSAKHASSAPGTHESDPALHVKAIGKITVQGTAHLVARVIKHSGSAVQARAAFNAQLKKIEGCA